MNAKALRGTLLAILFAACLVVLTGLSLSGARVVVASPAGPMVNGVQCEIVSSTTLSRTVYALNPALDERGRQECKRLVKDAAVQAAKDKQANDFMPGQVLVKYKGDKVKKLHVVPGNEKAQIAILLHNPNVEY